MKKVILLIVVVLLVAPLVTSCSLLQPSVDEARADFCADLGEFGTAVVNMRQIDAGSTVEELEAADKAVQDAWGSLKSSAKTLKGVKIDGVQQSFDGLEQTVGAISDEATLEEAVLSVKEAALATVAQVLEISQATCTYPATAE
jgi:hypothetical protein